MLVLTLSQMLKTLVIALRPKQWTKNLVVFFVLFFTVGEKWNFDDLGQAISLLSNATIAFALFSVLSSSVYLFNDICDRDRDRQHPKKRLRPIPSNQISLPFAWIVLVGLVVFGLGFSFALEVSFGWVALTYVVLMVAYSLQLKHIVLLDVFAISGGFLLRAVAGAAVLQVPVSPWLYTCTGLGALLIILAKRRSELTAAGENAGRQRGTLEWYTEPLLDQFIAVVAPSTLLAYIFYTFTAPNLPENHSMMLTIPVVFYGLFRYMYLVHSKNVGENPEEILITDIPMIFCIAMWLATAVAVLVVWG